MKPCLLFCARSGLPRNVQAILITIALCVGLVCSCSGPGLLSPEVSVRVVPPEPGRRWEIVWFNSAGARKTRAVSGDSMTITLDRGTFTPILLYPVDRADTDAGGRHFAGDVPAGALYPAEAEADLAGTFTGETTIRSDWTGGMLAECARAICASAQEGFDAGRKICGRVNWAKCRERIAGFQDSGAFDTERFVNAALAGEITARRVAEKKKAQIRLDIPGTEIAGIAPGTRFKPRNPLSPEFIWPDESPPVLSLADGHFLFRSPEGVIEGEVQDGKLVCAFFSPHVLQD